MAFQIMFARLQHWPRKMTIRRQPSRFSADFFDTLELLARELSHLKARNPVIIQTHLEASDIGQDGLPRADARPPHDPAVIVSFRRYLGYEPGKGMIDEGLSFPCDRFTDWKDNLRAIALTFEALHKVDLYGVTPHGEQYRGWVKPTQTNTGEREAAAFIASHSDYLKARIVDDRASFEAAYGQAVEKLHPEAGGKQEMFVRLQRAAEIIRKAHDW
jgi:hypothetical protein